MIGYESPTLGDTASGVLIDSILFSCVANSNNAFRTRSPAESDGVVDDGGRVSIEMMSSAACFK